MDWKKIGRYWDYFIWSLMALGMISLLILTIVGGIQSGDLTWTNLPVWIWNNPEMTYFFIGCFSAAAISVPALDWFGRTTKDKDDNGDAAAAVFFMLFLSAVLWPVVWGILAIDWYKDRKR